MNKNFFSAIFPKSLTIKDLPFETDLHSHILPGVDDGFKSVKESAQAVSELAALGVKNMILTPHIYPDLYPENDYDHITGLFSKYKSTLASDTGVNLQIAGEHMVYEGFDESQLPERILTLPGNHVLIEMSYAFESPNLLDAIFQLNCNGYKPILAHPERYLFYSGTSEIRDIAERGCQLQLNILSLGGFYGKHAAAKATALLEKGLYTYIGTDLHSLAQIEMLKSMRFKSKHKAELTRIMQNTTSLLNSQTL